MMALLSLGGVDFDGFEVSGSLRFGGAQQMAVHKLIGGVRVVDVLGRDDAAVRWCGIMSGPNAGDRARILDAMRAAGAQIGLAWDAFCYDVVISDLHLTYRNPWWISYEIDCLVISDLAQSALNYVVSTLPSVLSDLNAAAAYFNVSAAISAVSVSDASVAGGVSFAQASAALGATQTALLESISLVETGLSSNNLEQLVSSTGSLAQQCCAQGYIQRSAANFNVLG